ncbi:MAG: hypothetical protein JST50_04780 [Bacteroidetes bacterium]|jgi:flagellar basal body rod protein FlgC|nr:hypothetical protein [Bacteroidota bacterium]
MTSGNNSNAFCADYSNIASCLFSIQAMEDSGAFANYPEILRLLTSLEGDALLKLYSKTLIVLARLEGVEITSEYLAGDFWRVDFSETDFWVGYTDTTNTGYSSTFQTILNIFGVFCSRSSELTAAEIQSLNTVFIAVLDAFNALQQALIQDGLNPCGASTVNHYNNSTSLYLQAAGSDGSNGIAQGIHLRWSLAGDLGANHLPMGNYYTSSANQAGYNQPNDFVQVSRTPYANQAVVTLDLSSAIPAIDYASLRWTYTLNQVINSQNITNIVRLTFKDAQAYNQAALTTAPQANPFGFLKAYTGSIDLQVDNKNLFSVGYDFRLSDGQSSAVLRLEAFGISQAEGTSTESLNIRKTISVNSSTPATGTISGDDIAHVQLQTSGGYLQTISFETYADFIGTRSSSDWTTIGSPFALSLDDTTVFNLLETSEYPVDDLWPQYKDGTKVKVANYKDKWSTTHGSDTSIKATVQQYLSLGETDPRALVTVVEDSAAAAPGFLISYLDILNLMAMDYHVARMLGLGYIDATIADDAGQTSYVYKVSYTNRQSIGSTTMVTYEYMSLPTGTLDSRLPQTPTLEPITYQMPGDNTLTGGMFDDNGYAATSDVRLINLTRAPYNYELPDITLASDPSSGNDYNIFENSTSPLYGIEYRPATQTNYVKPAITTELAQDYAYYAYDPDFPETGVLETTLVPDNEANLYLHFEKNNGVHAYAIYGVNWFSRASALSNEEETDATAFPLRNSLLAPSEVAVQYIQEEDTPLFTTTTEQAWLAGRTAQFDGQDVDFTRVTFNRLDITDLSYVSDISTFDYSTVIKATKTKAWFKPGQPLQVTGVINDVVPGSNNLVVVYSGSYTQLDGTQAVPAIATADLPRFAGSLFVTPEGQFTVVSVAEGTDGPVFTLQQVAETNNIEDPSDPGFYGTNTTYTSPSATSRFTVTENLANSDNWYPVTEDIQLVNFGNPAAPLLESSTDDQGNVTRFLIGGLSDGAVIEQLNDTDGNVMPGYYSVNFNSVALDPHPQVNLPFDPANPGANAPGSLRSPNVEWYNGLIRIPLADGTDKKLVQVIRIIQSNPVQVYIYDAGYQDDPIQTSASSTDLVPLVNFHPGYRAYVFAEPAPSYFNGVNILPADQKGKKTLMSLQTTDTDTGGSGLVSPLSPPVILFARKVDVPVQPGPPITYGLKVRPDATTKAAFTFDIKILPDSSGAARSPFGFMFYRTSNEDVLEALYNPDTVASILTTLDGLPIDNNFNQRYNELVNLVFDTGSSTPGSFNVYDGYGFPVPDKTGLLAGGDTLDIIKSKCLDAIHSTLLPLTAQVPVLQYIKQGLQTDNKLPAIRTIDGDLLDPSSPSFDPFPMIRQYTNSSEANTTYVRFTDYMLNGSSRFLYFYSAAEVTNQLVIGPISPFAGPVTILHTIPAEAPLVKSFTLGPPAVVSDSPVAVTFYVTPFSPEDTITKMRIYRASDPNKALALVSMDTHVDTDIVMDSQLGIVVTDTFDDLTAIPFGDMIYYRLAFVRTISNENDQPEDVIGLGSDVDIINLIDTNNPDAPQLSYDQTSNTLSWPPTTNKGTYYLFQQNSKGNWQKIYSVTPTSATDAMTYTLPAPLPATDTDGNALYYRFKVTVQNSSGLLNLVDNELTI